MPLYVGQGVATKEGRVEVALEPNRILRVDQFSQVEFPTSDATGVESNLLSGSVIVEVLKGAGKKVVLQCGLARIELMKKAFIART